MEKKKQIIIAVLICIFGFCIFYSKQCFVRGKIFQDQAFTVWVFDIGHGDSIFIDAPGAQILIDGGPDDSVIEKLTQVLPFWDRKIDILVNTHPHADHVTGLVSVMNRYQVDQVWTSGQEYETGVYQSFEDQISYLQVLNPSSGFEFDLGDGGVLRVLWPNSDLEDRYLEDPNDGSIVLEIEYQDSKILLTGDIGIEQEYQILDQIDDINVLKVAHQGSYTSSSLEFLEIASPEYAIISAGENSFGHPHQVILDRLEQIKSQILITGEVGDVRVRVQNSEIKVQTFELN